MEKDHDYSAAIPSSFNTLDYSLDHHHQHLYPQNQLQHQQHQQQLMKFRIGETSRENNNIMVDYMPQTQPPPPPLPPPSHITSSGFYGNGNTSFDKLSFADVMQFADFGPKLALNQAKNCEESGIDPVYFLKFPVLNDKMEEQNLMVNQDADGGDDGEAENDERFNLVSMEDKSRVGVTAELEDGIIREEEETRVSDDNNSVQQLRFLGHEDLQKNSTVQENKNKRKRPRTVKTSEEVESQRMTHIAVERNRRKQMNEHLRVLRSLMPGSYVQRGDQASIIGGAIEFVRELEQLLQCLESQKRRRLLGEAQSRQVGDSGVNAATQQPLIQPPFFPPLPNDQMKLVELESGLREETAESKSCLADVEVKLLGFDAMIKILSRRRPGQLIKTIAALEDLQLIILHTNITTIEQTVLYSFNVKVASDSRFSAEDIASSVQQIFSFIHANTSM
ncbi:transcription factor FAMA isoform X2 [Gastrolobium bilobum]|uniref:transcription factor FAMA isoform X2 n=1 Tax=Gastrolobium bilobum TaxID=150636 RepID=UPI002AB29DFE|nr:transcription factor FAMA isoform X2 [Gastrolobium bilobum]